MNLTVEHLRRGLAGALFLLGVDTAYNVYGGTNSSPQTTDVFGDATRRRTLMKYVYIGGFKTIFYTGVASWLQRSWWPLIGGATAATWMHCLYVHAARQAARRAGDEPPPEHPAEGAATPRVGRPAGPWGFRLAPTSAR